MAHPLGFGLLNLQTHVSGMSRAMSAGDDLLARPQPLARWRGIDAVRGGHSAQPYCGAAARPPTAQSRGGIAPASRRFVVSNYSAVSWMPLRRLR
jgi:hypothetical protein